MHALFDIAAVHNERVGSFPLSVDRHLACVSIARNVAVVLRGTGGNRDDAGLQAQQVNVAAAVQRQAGQLFLSDDVPELSAGGIHLIGGAGDLNRLGDGTDCQLEVGSVLLIDFELDVGLHCGSKSRSFDSDPARNS